MAKFQSPLLGYNNNVRHRGRVFHIQTEDSGVNHPHIITHLFMDGGRILKSVKKSYAEHIGNDNLSETVKVMMKEQHKAMFIALRDGQFDELVEGQKAHEKKLLDAEKTKQAAAQAADAAAQAAKKESDEVAKEAPVPSTAKEESSPHEEVAQVAGATETAAEAEAAAPTGEGDDRTRDPSVEVEVAVAEITLPEVDVNDSEEITAAAAAMQAMVSTGSAPVESVATSSDRTVVMTSAASPADVIVPPPPSSEKGVGINEAPVMSMFSVGRSGEMRAAPPVAPSAGPATHPDPPRSSEEAAPLTIPESRRPNISQIPPSLGQARHPDELPPELAALLAHEEPPPGSATDPNMAMPGRARPGQVAASAKSGDTNPNTLRDPERRRPSAEELTLDFDALERDSSSVSPMFATGDLPPPPKNLFSKERGTGAYRAVDSDERDERVERTERTDRTERVERTERDRGSRIPPSRPHPNSPRVAAQPARSPLRNAPTAQKPSSEGRYAPARPAAIFGAASASKPPSQQHPPPPASGSIFSDDLVSDKSLDEVILSYLAEDLDPPRRK